MAIQIKVSNFCQDTKSQQVKGATNPSINIPVDFSEITMNSIFTLMKQKLILTLRTEQEKRQSLMMSDLRRYLHRQLKVPEQAAQVSRSARRNRTR